MELDVSIQKSGHRIIRIEEGSIAEELGIEAGDILHKINGEPVKDVFDFQFMLHDEYIEVEIEKADGEIWLLEIDKEYEEDLGVVFENGLMDAYKRCSNKCVFCFIDQLPDGMRDTLYFKDDDSRLSFLQGNYITLTNMTERDIDRIIEMKLEPINISFHTTNPELRKQMLHNRFAGEKLKLVDRLFAGGVTMNGQIVLCKGINDKEELKRSIRDLMKYQPCLQSVSVVPVGLTKFRDRLERLEPFNQEDAREVLTMIHEAQAESMAKYGNHFIHAGDEWYILAGWELPEESRYDGYLQIENGVGMITSLREEVQAYLNTLSGDDRTDHISIATGELAAPVLAELVSRFNRLYPNLRVDVHTIKNEFFGGKITVAGLLTGSDFIGQLQGKELGSRLLLTENVLKRDEPVLLDNVTVAELETALQVSITIVQSTGKDLIDAILGRSEG